MRTFLSTELNVDIVGEPNVACQNLVTSAFEFSFTTSDAECSTGAVLVCWPGVANDDCVVSSSSINHSFDSGLLLPRSTSFPLWAHTLMYSMSYLA